MPNARKPEPGAPVMFQAPGGVCNAVRGLAGRPVARRITTPDAGLTHPGRDHRGHCSRGVTSGNGGFGP
ncbi:hypothetical protein ACK6D9_05375 [Hoeflea sp. Naph1]|uniref:hypothetical protein n=1 Tax=Hoeflea sp. Naph1 TaxID=3388653 RepID=UPI00398F9EE2